MPEDLNNIMRADDEKLIDFVRNLKSISVKKNIACIVLHFGSYGDVPKLEKKNIYFISS